MFPAPAAPPGKVTVHDALHRAAYLSLFSTADPRRPSVPVPHRGDPGSLIGMDVTEQLHRLDARPQVAGDGRFVVRKRVGEPVAVIRMRWRVIPDDFIPGPDREPPPTALDMTRSQRFCMLDGHMQFRDRQRSGFRAFGTGRTFPVIVNGQPQLRIGAMVEVLEGLGKLRGLTSNVVVNGYIRPPFGLALSILARVADAGSRLRASTTLSDVVAMPDPDPQTTFLMLLGEPDPDQPVELTLSDSGAVTGSRVAEILRLVRVRFNVAGRGGVISKTDVGPPVGRLRATLEFNPMAGRVTPIRTYNGRFVFFGSRELAGTLNADLTDGWAIRTALPPVPMPVFRFGGFGPFIRGTGQFLGVTGLVSLNGIVSVFPRTLSNLYVLRISDPHGRFRALSSQSLT